jgi:hypothetical protein
MKETLTRVPVWTIGRKSRGRRIAREDDAARPRDVLVIDQIVLDLNTIPNPVAARQYAMQHAELGAVVDEILTAVFEERSDQPVEFIKEFCAHMWQEQADRVGVEHKKWYD